MEEVKNVENEINYKAEAEKMAIQIARLRDENYNLKMAINSLNGVVMNEYKKFEIQR